MPFLCPYLVAGNRARTPERRNTMTMEKPANLTMEKPAKGRGDRSAGSKGGHGGTGEVESPDRFGGMETYGGALGGAV